MISKIYIIRSNGDLIYSKTFFGANHKDTEVIKFLTSINHVGQKVIGGKLQSVNFTNFSFVYSYDEKDCMFIVVSDIRDSEEEVRSKLELLKEEFFKTKEDPKLLKEFDAFAENYIHVPPKILLVGEPGVGKSSIMNLFPGETILELDDDLNEIIEKSITLSDLEGINHCILREMDIQNLIEHSRDYSSLLSSVNVICIVTNSGAGNLSRTLSLYSRLKEKVRRADFYVIANFQDSVHSAFDPEKISESFGLTAFGFSATQNGATDKIYAIIKKILEISIIERYETHETKIIT